MEQSDNTSVSSVETKTKEVKIDKVDKE